MKKLIKGKKFLSLVLGCMMATSAITPAVVSAATDETKDCNTGNYDISAYHFYQFSDSDTSWSDGPWAKENISYTPLWGYNQETTGKDELVSGVYFRTDTNDVAYCLNFGKQTPVETIKPSDETTLGIQRVITKGYPIEKGSTYGISDIELEWATGIALRIVEGNGYDQETGEIVPNSQMKMDYFYDGALEYTFTEKNFPGIPKDVEDSYTEEANKLREVIQTLVNVATDTSIVPAYMNFDANGSTLSVESSNVNTETLKFGPITLKTSSENTSFSFSKNTPNYFITDAQDNKLTEIPTNKEFYININPSDVSGSVDFSLMASDNKTIKYPTILFANDVKNQQSMYVVKGSPLKDSISMKIDYNEVNLGNLSVKKIDEDTSEGLKDVEFEIKDNKDNSIQKGKTNEEGIVTFSDLIPGSYRLFETSAVSGYLPLTSPFNFTVNEDGSITGAINNVITVPNKPTKVVITKTDITSADPVPGATIQIKDELHNVVFEGKTNEDGEISVTYLPVGSYTFTETNAPDGYVISEEIFPFVINEDGTIAGNTNITNAPTEVTITKTDITDGKPLPGATIEIKDSDNNVVYKDVTDNKGEITAFYLSVGTYTFTETKAPSGYTLNPETFTFAINKDGSITGDTSISDIPTKVVLSKKDFTTSAAVKNAEIEIRDSEDTVVFTGLTDKNGEISVSYLPIGTYTFVETKAPDGFIASNTKFSFTINEDGSIAGDTTFTNKPTRVTITKTDAETGKPLAGANIVIKNSSSYVVYNNKTDKNGNVVVSYLPAGTYTFTETIAPEGYSLNKNIFKFTIDKDGVITGDSEIKNVPTSVTLTKSDFTTAAPVEGATIKINGVDNNFTYTGISDSDGHIAITHIPVGTYTFTEISAPKGYTLNKETFTFTVKEDGSIDGDTEIKDIPTKVEILKTDTDTNAPLAGAEIDIKDENGHSVAKGKTNTEGKFVVTYLPVGKYTYTETKAPAGYIAASNTYSFEIKEDGTVTGTLSFTNKLSAVTILKLDQTTRKPLPGAIFVVKDASGKEVYAGETNKDGKLIIFGLSSGIYTYTETKAPSGYILSTKTYTFIIDENGKVTGDTEITNKSISVTLTKKDITTGDSLSGATLEVRDANNNIVAKGVTDKNGKFTINSIAVGTYTFTETIAPEGYDLNTNTLKFSVGSDGSISGDVEIFDAPASTEEKPTTPTGEETTTPSGDTPSDDGSITPNITPEDDGVVSTGNNGYFATIMLLIITLSTFVLFLIYKKRSTINY